LLPLGLALVVSRAAPRFDTGPQTLRREGVAYVVPLGEVSSAEVARAAWALGLNSHRTVVVLPARPLPSAQVATAPAIDPRLDLWSAGTPDQLLPTPIPAAGRLDARQLLDTLLTDAPDDAWRILGVTAEPMFTPGDDDVMGYARRGERALVYSTSALPDYDTEAAHRRRVRRIVAHELGHTFGAGHCDTACVMHTTRSAGDIDLLSDHYCPEHQALAHAARTRGLDHPDEILGRASEHLRLGHWTQASDALREALALRPEDPRLHTSLGVSLMASGALASAEEVFLEAARKHPRSPQPYYGLAVLFAAGWSPQRAPTFLEAAVRRDTDPARAHRAAGILYQDLLDDRLHAVRHFEAHVQKGGRDMEVIARLSRLLAPAALVFTQPDIVVARWDAQNGFELSGMLAQATLNGAPWYPPEVHAAH
jgi:tetratricopeptide (TPR) repeat protein